MASPLDGTIRHEAKHGREHTIRDKGFLTRKASSAGRLERLWILGSIPAARILELKMVVAATFPLWGNIMMGSKAKGAECVSQDHSVKLRL
jgi:hypothetical protein